MKDIETLFENAWRGVKLTSPYVEAKSIEELARAFHFESDRYRQFLFRWIRAGLIALVVTVFGIVLLNIWMHAIALPDAIWISVNLVSCTIGLYTIGLLGKQIVATREIVYAYAERVKIVQALLCLLETLKSDEGKRNVVATFVAVLVSRLPSPFAQGKVAGDAEFNSLKEIIGGLHGK